MECSRRSRLSELGLDLLVLVLALCVGAGVMAAALLMLDMVFTGMNTRRHEMYTYCILGAFAIGSVLGAYSRHAWHSGVLLLVVCLFFMRALVTSPTYTGGLRVPLLLLTTSVVTLGAIALATKLNRADWAREAARGLALDSPSTGVRILLAILGLAGAFVVSICVSTSESSAAVLRILLPLVFLCAFALLARFHRI